MMLTNTIQKEICVDRVSISGLHVRTQRTYRLSSPHNPQGDLTPVAVALFDQCSEIGHLHGGSGGEAYLESVVVQAFERKPPCRGEETLVRFGEARKLITEFLDRTIRADLGLVAGGESAAPNVDDDAAFLVLPVHVVSQTKRRDRWGRGWSKNDRRVRG